MCEPRKALDETMKLLAWPAFSNKSVNPYNYMLYKNISVGGVHISEWSVANIIKRRYDIVHVHWPESIVNAKSRLRAHFKVLALFAVLDFLKAKGSKLVWTVHNLQPHERFQPAIEPLFYSGIVARLDGVIYLSNSSKRAAEIKYPGLRGVLSDVIPHGHYRGVYPNTIEKNEARKVLGIKREATVLLSFGQLRPYKGVERLVSEFENINDDNLYLWVVGRPVSDKYADELVSRIKNGSHRIKVVPRFVDDVDVQLYMNAADMVVLSYTNVLNSGSALLALSFNRPVVVPNCGSMPELAEMVGDEWVFTYDPPISRCVLKNALVWLNEEKRVGCVPIEGLSWSKISNATLKFYQRLLGKSDSVATCADVMK